MKPRLNLRHARLAIFICALILLSGWLGFWLGTHQFKVEFGKQTSIKIEKKVPPEKQNVDFSLFWDVWDRLEKNYLDKTDLDQAKMVFGAIQGMVASLNDPYTVFLKPQENKEAKEDLNGAFEGVGIQIGFQDGQLAVIAPLSGMPAQKMGVKAGDLILKIDDKETGGMTLPEAVRLIRGPKGTQVKLTLLHKDGKEPYEAVITRDTIIVPSVEVEFKESAECRVQSTKCVVAHLKLMRFGDRTSEEWNKAVSLIIDHQPSVIGIILDLRNNPGGYLSGSVFIASEFLPSGIVVQQEHADGTKETFSVNRQGRLTTQPLVVLINGGSASASEIVAGALKDYKRAKIVGEKSFGKGTIQEAQDLPGGSGLHITTARWLLPKGESVDKEGVKPDFEVKDDSGTEKDEQLEKAIEILVKS